MKLFSRSVLFPSAILLGILSGHVNAAERDPILMMGEGGLPGRSSIDYQFRDAPEDSAGSPIVTEHRENARFILSKTSQEMWSVQERFAHVNLSAPVTAPETGLSIPRSLWSLGTGAGYSRRLDDGRSLGVNASVGSDSDRLFYTIHETAVQAGVNYRLPSGPTNAWLFFLQYSNNRHFLNNIPLPGFAYYYHSPSTGVRAVAGFPFVSIFYTPTPRWDARFSLFGPRRVSTDVGVKISGPIRLYGGFEWSQLEWMRSGRNDNANRLFFDRKRLVMGIQSPVSRSFSLDFSGGREFDRRFYENRSSSTSDVPTAGLPASWVIDVKFTYNLPSHGSP